MIHDFFMLLWEVLGLGPVHGKTKKRQAQLLKSSQKLKTVRKFYDSTELYLQTP